MTYPIFEGNGAIAPRRPTLADFGGREFESVLRCLPNDRRRAPRNGYIQLAMAIDRACRSLPLLSVDFQTSVAGQPGTLLHVNSVVDGLNSSTVRVDRYASSRYTITWPSGSLPPAYRPPECVQLHSLYRGFCRAYQTANSCLVICFDKDAAYTDTTDYRFNVTFWGE